VSGAACEAVRRGGDAIGTRGGAETGPGVGRSGEFTTRGGEIREERELPEVERGGHGREGGQFFESCARRAARLSSIFQ